MLQMRSKPLSKLNMIRVRTNFSLLISSSLRYLCQTQRLQELSSPSITFTIYLSHCIGHRESEAGSIELSRFDIPQTYFLLHALHTMHNARMGIDEISRSISTCQIIYGQFSLMLPRLTRIKIICMYLCIMYYLDLQNIISKHKIRSSFEWCRKYF
jgi:hypothetical protein